MWWTGLIFFTFRALVLNQWNVSGHYDRYKQYKNGLISKKIYFKDLLLLFVAWLWSISALYFATEKDILGVYNF